MAGPTFRVLSCCMYIRHVAMAALNGWRHYPHRMKFPQVVANRYRVTNYCCQSCYSASLLLPVIPCREPPTLPNATMLGPAQSPYVHGDTMSYNCSDGYWTDSAANTTVTVRCSEGEWLYVDTDVTGCIGTCVQHTSLDG